MENPELARAYEDFREAAVALSGVGMLFEMVHRPDPRFGGLVPREPRNLSIAAVPEAALGADAATVVLMGVGFWEFLPGFFFGSDRIIDGRRMAMDTGSFRFTENTPSGDAEIIGQTEAGPLAQYMRIDISGDGLVKSLAVSNLALGGAFVAAYRNYVEVLAGYPYKLLHPYRQLSLPQAQPQLQPGATAAQPAARPVVPTLPGAGALPASRPAPPPRSAAPSRRGPSGVAWGWLAVPPLVALAFYLGSLTSTGEPEEGPTPPPARSTGSVVSPPASLAPATPPAALAPVPEVSLPPPPPVFEEGDGLPLPPPPAPPPPPRRAGGTDGEAPPVIEPAPGPRNLTLPEGSGGMGSGYVHPPLAAPAQLRMGVVRQSANVRASPNGGSPVLRVLGPGTPLRIVEENLGWLRVTTEDGEALGWIYGTLVR
ncbi:SH3 domain-containing protein [Teichococcus oryzae]|uniref:SH3 domain-containing protein n=1 Tax=Teichococcus oryzae TaxID=1608942 RepID=A0A5B2TD35_9PROT|nr:SH3 domain-containing protein [Pseudoroseomonas oryzae]KAA2211758.1 SH3 domain-containing protein [Pseudoroseomonas oryzae]